MTICHAQLLIFELANSVFQLVLLLFRENISHFTLKVQWNVSHLFNIPWIIFNALNLRIQLTSSHKLSNEWVWHLTFILCHCSISILQKCGSQNIFLNICFQFLDCMSTENYQNNICFSFFTRENSFVFQNVFKRSLKSGVLKKY